MLQKTEEKTEEKTEVQKSTTHDSDGNRIRDNVRTQNRIENLKSLTEYASINELASMIDKTVYVSRLLLIDDHSIELFKLDKSIVAKRIDLEKFASAYIKNQAVIEKQKIEKDLQKEKDLISKEKDRDKKILEREEKRKENEKKRQENLVKAQAKRVESDKKRKENEQKRSAKLKESEQKRLIQLTELADKYKDNKEYQNFLAEFKENMINKDLLK